MSPLLPHLMYTSTNRHLHPLCTTTALLLLLLSMPTTILNWVVFFASRNINNIDKQCVVPCRRVVLSFLVWMVYRCMEMCIRTSLYIAYVVSVERQNYYRSNSTKLLIYFPGNKNLHWRHVICFQFSQEIANQTVSKVIHENEKEKQGKQPLDSSMKIRDTGRMFTAAPLWMHWI